MAPSPVPAGVEGRLHDGLGQRHQGTGVFALVGGVHGSFEVRLALEVALAAAARASSERELSPRPAQPGGGSRTSFHGFGTALAALAAISGANFGAATTAA